MSQTGSANQKLSIVSLFLAGILLAVLIFFSVIFIFSSSDSILALSLPQSTYICNCNVKKPQRFNLRFDPPVSTFYDDPNLGYTIDNPIKNWDEKRRQWLKLHPTFVLGSYQRVFLVTGSESKPCKNPKGDHFLLRFYRNKVDYCRIHGYDIFYNNVLLDPKMKNSWAKLPALRAAMVAHPEAEWIWWIDEDAVFTDMDFKIPLERYKDRNLVVHGRPKEVHEEKFLLGLINAGSFILRNCQWSLNFLEKWADMGPQSKNHEKWSEILLNVFNHEADDQTALAYLLVKEREKQSSKVYIETEYYFEGDWVVITDTLKNITKRYMKIVKEEKMLRRRHAELVSGCHAKLWEPHLKDAGYGYGSWRRPFVTHFAGCRPCIGHHNPSFSRQSCWEAMERVLNFVDNQVLRNYGFVHRDLSDPSSVSPLPFH